MQNDLDILKKENDALKKENERLRINNTILKDSSEEKERSLNSVLKENESLALKIKGSGEWEKIAQTISHTMKGPNNNIVNKLKELNIKMINPSKDIGALLTTIESEARYSNDIIGLFDIIRKGDTFKTESIQLSEIIEIIRNSEKRCISLAWNDASQLSKHNLDRIKGEVLSNQRRYTEQDFLNIKYPDSLDLQKLYIVHKTAFITVIDEFILNMFRYAMSFNKPIPYAPHKEKPEYFEIEIVERTDEVQEKNIALIFRNSSREQIYKAYKNINADEKNISLTKKSFGLYLASLFSGRNPNFPNINFYDLKVPKYEQLSEIILTLKASNR